MYFVNIAKIIQVILEHQNRMSKQVVLNVLFIEIVLIGVAFALHGGNGIDSESQLFDELSEQFINQTHQTYSKHLHDIERYRTTLDRIFSSVGAKDDKTIASELEIAAVLENLHADIVKVNIQALEAINSYFMCLKTIIASREQLATTTATHRLKKRALNSDIVNEIADLAINITSRTMQSSQTNFNSLYTLIVKLKDTFRSLYAHDINALSECERVTDLLTEMLGNYENKVLILVHEALLSLSQKIHMHLFNAQATDSASSSYRQHQQHQQQQQQQANTVAAYFFHNTEYVNKQRELDRLRDDQIKEQRKALLQNQVKMEEMRREIDHQKERAHQLELNALRNQQQQQQQQQVGTQSCAKCISRDEKDRKRIEALRLVHDELRSGSPRVRALNKWRLLANDWQRLNATGARLLATDLLECVSSFYRVESLFDSAYNELNTL